MPDPPGRSDGPQVPGVFATTHWTQVLAARGESSEAKEALRELCDAYYAPVHAFICRWRHGADDARDLTHDFFARLLAGHSLDHMERGHGRFRSYLLGAVKHFLSDLRQREQAAKRGRGASPISLHGRAPTADDRDTPSCGCEPADAPGFPPDAFFDRQWALNLLERVLTALAHEQEQAGKTREFETLRPYLTGDAGLSPSAAGAALGVSVGAVKVAIHRLRKRFRHMVRAEIVGTVEHGDEVSSEIDYLIQALSHAAVELASESSPAPR